MALTVHYLKIFLNNLWIQLKFNSRGDNLKNIYYYTRLRKIWRSKKKSHFIYFPYGEIFLSLMGKILQEPVIESWNYYVNYVMRLCILLFHIRIHYQL